MELHRHAAVARGLSFLLLAKTVRFGRVSQEGSASLCNDFPRAAPRTNAQKNTCLGSEKTWSGGINYFPCTTEFTSLIYVRVVEKRKASTRMHASTAWESFLLRRLQRLGASERIPRRGTG